MLSKGGTLSEHLFIAASENVGIRNKQKQRKLNLLNKA